MSAIRRVGDPTELAEVLGFAVATQLGQKVQGMRKPDLSTFERTANRAGGRPRELAEVLLVAATTGDWSKVLDQSLRSLSQTLSEKPDLALNSDDGQVATILLSKILSLVRDSSELVTNPEEWVCAATSPLPDDLTHVRQRLVGRLVGCSGIDIPASVTQVAPAVDVGCHVLLSSPGVAEEMGNEWVAACWRDLFSYALEGTDHRALGNVLTILSLGDRDAFPSRSEARTLATVAGRSWRFGGGVSPYQGLDLRSTIEFHWLAEQMLRTDPFVPTVEIDVGPLGPNTEDWLLLDSAGLLVSEAQVAKARSLASTEVLAAMAAVEQARSGTCSFEPGWARLAKNFLSEPGSELQEVLAPLVKNRLAHCDQGGGQGQRNLLRAASLRKTLLKTLASDTVGRSQSGMMAASATIGEICALGLSPGADFMQAVSAVLDVTKPWSEVGLEYSPQYLAASIHVSDADHGECGEQWWS